MDIGEGSSRISIIPFIRFIPFISYIPISPFSYTKDFEAPQPDQPVFL
jgi:hypothetical protein